MSDGPGVVWVVAVALLAADGRVLMQRRRPGRTHGGLWEFPGGKIEAGESPDHAAARELREELGVELDVAALQPVSFAADTGAQPGRKPHAILLYACGRWRGEALCLDAEEIGWFAPDRLALLAMPPLDYPLARALAAALEKGHLDACQAAEPALNAPLSSARSSAG